MITLLKKFSIHISILSLFIIPVLTFSQATPTTPPTPPTVIGITISNPFNCGGVPPCTIMTLIVSILNNVIMPIAAVGVVIFIIHAGFMFVMAQGKPAEIEKAKQRLLWGLIGAGILLGAAGISSVVQSTVNSLIR